MVEKAVIIKKRFGDEQSDLLDQYERMTFEAHLNRTMLVRGPSEPATLRHITDTNATTSSNSVAVGLAPNSMAIPLVSQVKQRRRRGSGFNKLLKNLLKPILWRKSKARKQVPDPEDPYSCQDFSASLHF